MGCVRDVVGIGDVHGDAVVRINTISGRAGSTDANLFLNGKDKIEVVLRLLQLLHGHQQHHTGNAVVQIG